MKKYCMVIFLSVLIGTQYTMAQFEPSKCIAYALYKSKQYNDAIRMITDSVKGKDFDTYSIIANCYYEQKDYQNALENYLKANELVQGELNDKIAICYANLKDDVNAVKYLKRSISLTGRPLLSEVSILCNHLGVEPTTLFDNASKQLNDAALAIESKDFDQAIQILDSPEKGINKSMFYYFRALAFYDNGSIKQAETDMRKAIKWDAKLKSNELFKNVCFASNDSVEYYSFIISQTSSFDLDFLIEKVHAFLVLNKLESAQQLIDQIGPICERFDIYSRKLISIYKKNGDYLNAFKMINKLIDLNKADYKLLNERGQLFLDAKMYQEAKHDFSMSLDICPNQAEAYYQRGTARQALGEQSGAESDWRNAKNLGYFK